MTQNEPGTARKDEAGGSAPDRRQTPPEKKKLDKELDQALEDSFPASDPPSASQPTSTEPAGDPRVKP